MNFLEKTEIDPFKKGNVINLKERNYFYADACYELSKQCLRQQFYMSTKGIVSR